MSTSYIYVPGSKNKLYGAGAVSGSGGTTTSSRIAKSLSGANITAPNFYQTIYIRNNKIGSQYFSAELDYWSGPGGAAYYPGDTLPLGEFTLTAVYKENWNGMYSNSYQLPADDPKTGCTQYWTNGAVNHLAGTWIYYEPTVDYNWSSYHLANSYELTFNGNGGTLIFSDSTSTQYTSRSTSIKYGSKYGSGMWPCGGYKDGYIFNDMNVDSSTTYSTAGPVTIYANWQSSECTVSFYSDGGTSCESIIVKYDGKYEGLPTTTREGYTFNGWYDKNNKLVKEGDKVTISGDHTLTAKWTAISYKVKFDKNEASSGSMNNQTFTYDEAKKLTANAYAKHNYIFIGWAEDKSTNEVKYKDEQVVSNLSSTQGGEVTLYAVWKYNAPISVKGEKVWRDLPIDDSVWVKTATQWKSIPLYNIWVKTDNGWKQIAEKESK